MTARAESAAGKPLSEEENLIMQLLARGKAPKEIAQFLGVAETHISQRSEYIRAKLGAVTTVQAMHLWTMARAAHGVMSVDDRLRARADGIAEGCE